MEKTTVRKNGNVILGDAVIGSISREESCRTGFRHGVCVGQVSCFRYAAKDADGKVIPYKGHEFGDLWLSRKDALDAVLRAHMTKP